MASLLENAALKAISLGLAVLVWFVIAAEKTSEIGLQAPLELQNFPANLELVGEPVNSVQVRFRASPGVIHRLNPGDVSAVVDLQGLAEGEHILHLTADAIRVPYGVKVVKISPSIVTLNLDQTIEKTVPVNPRLTGRPAPGYEVADVESDPKEVRIAGPRSRVNGLTSAYTEVVPVEGAQASVVALVNVGLGDPLLRLQGTPKARVAARIREVLDTRTYELDVEVRGGGAQVRPPRVTVVLSGPTGALRAVQATDIHASVEVTDGQSGNLPVVVSLGPGLSGVTVKETRPAQVHVRLVRTKG